MSKFSNKNNHKYPVHDKKDAKDSISMVSDDIIINGKYTVNPLSKIHKTISSVTPEQIIIPVRTTDGQFVYSLENIPFENYNGIYLIWIGGGASGGNGYFSIGRFESIIVGGGGGSSGQLRTHTFYPLTITSGTITGNVGKGGDSNERNGAGTKFNIEFNNYSNVYDLPEAIGRRCWTRWTVQRIWRK